VAAELVIAAVVLVFSALLVVSDPHVESSSAGMSGMPGMSMAAGSVSGSVTLPTGPVATISISPAMAGSPTINIVTASAGGGSLDPVEVDATAALPARGIEPIPLTLTRTSAGHYVVNGAPLGFPGTWTITVTVRTSDIDSGVGTVNLVLH
jgi:copper transport protein